MTSWARTSIESLSTMLRSYSPAAWLVTIVGTASALLLIGIPTRLIANGWFIRMTPTRVQDYVIWVLSALLIGLIVGSFALGRATQAGDAKLVSGGMFSYLAVGCPVCNKLVVFVIGTSGALTFFGPLQLYIGIGSVLLLAWTLVLRARALTLGCTVASTTAFFGARAN